jgi:hypothetical protein
MTRRFNRINKVLTRLLSAGASAHYLIFLPLLPKGGEGRGEEADFSRSKPLAPALSPLRRGEGVAMRPLSAAA